MKIIFFITFFISMLFSNELINVNLKNLKLMELVNISSNQLGINILTTNDIKGRVNFISKKPIYKKELFKLLKLSLNENGYSLVKNGSFYKIIEKKSFIDSKIDIKKSFNNDISTKVIPILNNNAQEIKIILDNIVSKRPYKDMYKPSISLDKSNNLLILDGNSTDIMNLANIIKKIDKPKMQVFVKAHIVEVDDNLIEEIGVKYGILGGSSHSGNINTFSSILNDGNALAFNPTNLGLDIPNVKSTIALGATLNLLNKTYALDIISQPSILCLNNEESSIYVGETMSIQIASTTTDGGTIKNSFRREDIGLSLKVKPTISDDNKVLLKINTILEGVKSLDTLSLNPNTTKKQVITNAIVNNGESVIIGGLIETKREKSIQKIPLASDIPLIGELFKNRRNSNQKRNLVVIITPYIIPNGKDLTYVREKLAKLKVLEDKFLANILIELKKKQEKQIKEKAKPTYNKAVQQYFKF